MNKNNKGFTLIELLVVISIIGILATLLIANFNSSRARARDAQRKSDLRNIQTALRLYYNDFNKYPESTNSVINGCGGSGTSACTWGGSFSVTGKDPYMTLLPADSSTDRKYVYSYVAATDVYTLSSCLENKSDAKCGVNCTSAYGTSGNTPDGCIYSVSP